MHMARAQKMRGPTQSLQKRYKKFPFNSNASISDNRPHATIDLIIV